MYLSVCLVGAYSDLNLNIGTYLICVCIETNGDGGCDSANEWLKVFDNASVGKQSMMFSPIYCCVCTGVIVCSYAPEYTFLVAQFFWEFAALPCCTVVTFAALPSAPCSAALSE